MKLFFIILLFLPQISFAMVDIDEIKINNMFQYVSGSASGKILTSDATGNATWENNNHTTDTNAGTLCSAGQYLDGDATCKAIPVDTDTTDHSLLTNVTTSQHHIKTVDTNAGTICSAGQFLNGDGTCDAVVTDTNAGTICSTGQYLDGDGTCKTAGGSPNSYESNATSFESTSSNTYVDVATTTLTPPSGKYLVILSAQLRSSASNGLTFMTLGVNGSAQTSEERHMEGTDEIPTSAQFIHSANGTTVFTIMLKKAGGGNAEIMERSIIMVKVL